MPLIPLIMLHPYKEIAPVFDNSPYLKLVPGVQGFDVPSRDGLLGEWLFEDNVNDTSGNNYHGTHVGTPTYVTDRTWCWKGNQLERNKYVKVDDGQNQTVFNGDKKFTISTWVKEQPDGGWEPWISKRGENGRGWQLRREGGGVIMFTTNGPSGGDGNMRKEWFGIIPNGITWLLCTVPEMAHTSGFMSMENYLSSKEWGQSIGMPICSYLEQGITIIHLVIIPILTWMMCVSTTVH